MGLWTGLAPLPLTVETVRLVPLELATPGGWVRRTTVVRLEGLGEVGQGEDVNYDGDEQAVFQANGPPDRLTGEMSLESFTRRLDGADVLFAPTKYPASRCYRRWAFESAALDLALRQCGLSLADALGRRARRVRFAASLGLGDPASISPLVARRKVVPRLRFKLDWSPSWDESVLRDLSELDAVDVVDFKGRYHGEFTGPPPDAEAYRRVAEWLPGAILEDAAWTHEVLVSLRPFRERLSCDAPLHSLSDVVSEPFRPQWVNVKPSRFGSIAETLRVYEWCENSGARAYGGGQFELGPGRLQIQALASIFHADAPNDVAPVAYHRFAEGSPLPKPPLKSKRQPGFGPD